MTEFEERYSVGAQAVNAIIGQIVESEKQNDTLRKLYLEMFTKLCEIRWQDGGEHPDYCIGCGSSACSDPQSKCELKDLLHRAKELRP